MTTSARLRWLEGVLVTAKGLQRDGRGAGGAACHGFGDMGGQRLAALGVKAFEFAGQGLIEEKRGEGHLGRLMAGGVGGAGHERLIWTHGNMALVMRP
ncbi:MAG: hypothetical protein ACMVO5_11160 [Polymorphobacter sp.]|uniref:hypothetical protein n=1 Tax=Polymorphobacter sp. TaxID=1909290 RepID=UPI003A87CF08